MKVIHLIRHSDSTIESIDNKDFSRCLSKEGIIDLNLMTNQLVDLNCTPDYFISSSSTRTTQTTKVISEAIGYDSTQIIFDKKIYNASLSELLNDLNSIPNKFNNVLLVGHNPSLTLLSNYLTNDYIDNIPTSGIVKIEIDVDDWQHIIEGIGRKIFFIYPEMF